MNKGGLDDIHGLLLSVCLFSYCIVGFQLTHQSDNTQMQQVDIRIFVGLKTLVV